jgi:hypothetical protein
MVWAFVNVERGPDLAGPVVRLVALAAAKALLFGDAGQQVGQVGEVGEVGEAPVGSCSLHAQLLAARGIARSARG